MQQISLHGQLAVCSVCALTKKNLCSYTASLCKLETQTRSDWATWHYCAVLMHRRGKRPWLHKEKGSGTERDGTQSFWRSTDRRGKCVWELGSNTSNLSPELQTPPLRMPYSLLCLQRSACNAFMNRSCSFWCSCCSYCQRSRANGPTLTLWHTCTRQK